MSTIISNGTTFVFVRNKIMLQDEAPDGVDELIGSVDGMQALFINLGQSGTPLSEVELMALMRADDGSFNFKDITEVGQQQPKSAVVKLLRGLKENDDS